MTLYFSVPAIFMTTCHRNGVKCLRSNPVLSTFPLRIQQPWFSAVSSAEGCDTAPEECVLNFQTRGPVWLRLVSVWHVPARCTLGPRWIAVCFCWSAGPHIWATCVFETEEPKWNTHWDAEVLRLQLHSWKQTHWLRKGGGDCHGWNGIPGIIWWTSHCYSFISFIVLK